MKVLEELGQGKSLEDFPEIDNKNEDWKYISIPKDLNSFTTSQGSNQGSSSEEIDVLIHDEGIEIINENKSFQIEDVFEVNTPFIEDYSKRPIDRFVFQQKEKVTSGIVINFIESSETPLRVEIQSSGLNVPYIGLFANKNISSSIELIHSDALSGTSFPMIDSKISNDSHISLYIKHDSSQESELITSFYSQIGKDSSLDVKCASFGSSLSRIRFDIDLDGIGSSFNIEGVYFADKERLIDYRVFVNHNVKNTSSNMLLKGALVDESSSVFTGTIHIAEGAEKTVSHQINRNLVLNDKAKAHSVPNLEILCDDVICGHGSSVGPIDDELFHYVMSRGIPRLEAEKLLIRGFFNEVLNKDKWESHREEIANKIKSRYEKSLESKV